MKYDACTDCGVEKTMRQQRSARCGSCAASLRNPAVNTRYASCVDCGKSKTNLQQTAPRCNSCAGSLKRIGKIPWNKGQTCSLADRNKISLAKGGNGDILNRKFPGLPRWTRLVKERDGYCCAECGYQGTPGKRDVDAHHVIPKSKFPDLATVLFNGVTLCKPCHKDIHATS
jgi:hypothetical protein